MIVHINNICSKGYGHTCYGYNAAAGSFVSKKQADCSCAPNTGNISFKALKDIVRFKQVDETLYRGARPNLEQLFDLKNLGISRIIDFSVEPTRIEGFSEAATSKNIGIKYFQIPLVSWENPTDKQVEEFFDIIKSAKEKNEMVYIHCLEGKDRTGLFTELYKIKYGLSDAQTSINNLIKGRYNFNDNVLAVPFIKEFAQKVSANSL